METQWIRGEQIGHGSSATISKAKPKTPTTTYPPVIAVKSSEADSCGILRNEKSILDRLGGDCPHVIRCFGDDTTFEGNESHYNLLLEFAANGSLADQMRLRGGRLPEREVRRHARSILKGLCFIHGKGVAHCDIKPENILVFEDGVSKIADFGLSKTNDHDADEDDCCSSRGVGERCELRGTPMYMSPEAVNCGVYAAASDVWALGCAVAVMATGKPVWSDGAGGVLGLLIRIGGDEEPEVAGEVSELGRDFLSKCLVKDPRKRWTAEMLLSHAFVADVDGEDVVPEYSSPRCPFDFPEWNSGSDFWTESVRSSSSSVTDRVKELVFGGDVEEDNWSCMESWVTVRG